MNQIALVIVVALAASALIMGTAGKPAAAGIKIHFNQRNDQTVICNTTSSCSDNFQQAANTIIFSGNNISR